MVQKSGAPVDMVVYPIIYKGFIHHSFVFVISIKEKDHQKEQVFLTPGVYMS